MGVVTEKHGSRPPPGLGPPRCLGPRFFPPVPIRTHQCIMRAGQGCWQWNLCGQSETFATFGQKRLILPPARERPGWGARVTPLSKKPRPFSPPLPGTPGVRKRGNKDKKMKRNMQVRKTKKEALLGGGGTEKFSAARRKRTKAESQEEGRIEMKKLGRWFLIWQTSEAFPPLVMRDSRYQRRNPSPTKTSPWVIP